MDTSLSLGKFEFISTLQVNAGVAVVLCRDPVSGKPVICKTAATAEPSEEVIASLKREYELTVKVQGHDIIQLQALEKSVEGHPILVFKEFQGVPLTAPDQPLQPAEYIPLFIRIAKALGCIHEKKIIHRDLNPDNILWNQETRDICIIDFNLATDILSETVKSNSVDKLYGTLPFIAPEQTGRMNRKVDFRSDYYSLGMTLYQFLTGVLPFEATDAISWVYCHIAEQPPLASEKNPRVPVEIALIIDKLLAKNAEDRYQSSYGLIKDFEKVAAVLAGQGLENFVPGESDVIEWLNIPEKLYGRENELAAFLSFFDHVKAGEKLMCVIAGASGMGKSVLVNEVNKPVVEARGNFISGKCDQYKRNIPYSAVKDAFGDLIRQYLAKSNEEVESLQQQIAMTLGENAKVISDIIPEFEALAGTQEPLPKLPPKEARRRFQKAFEQLIQIFTTSGQPLVAFLDDLQWSDIPSLKLIEFLMIEADVKSLMIIAVFRDNEVQPGHPLLATLDEVKKVHEIRSIKLSPLSKASTNQLLADTFHYDPQDTVELADILYTKSAGNPFHITEMIKSLHDADAIYFDSEQGKWLWTFDKIANAGISSDVVEMMVATLQKCPMRTQELLKIAACVGAQFELNTLASLCEVSVTDALNDVWTTIEKGLIIPLGESYKLLKTGMGTDGKEFYFKFQHDRVHEAAYTLIEDNDRAGVHLKIGRLLRARFKGHELDRQIIDVIRHLNLGAELITDPVERIDTCQLNYAASVKTRNSVAHEANLHYLQVARSYLPENAWTEHYGLARRVHMSLSEAAYIMADYALVDQVNSDLLRCVHDVLDRAEVESMRVEQAFNKGETAAAIEIGRASLRALGQSFPSKPGKASFLISVAAVKRQLKSVDLNEVIHRRLDDRRISLILKKLVTLNIMFFNMGDRISSALSILLNLRISLRYGNCGESAYGFVGSASIFSNLLGEYELSTRLGKIGLELEEKYGSPSLKPTIYYVYGNFVAPYSVDLEDVADYFATAIEAGMTSGDQYILSVAATLLLTVAPRLNLEESAEKAENYYLPMTRKAHVPMALEAGLGIHRYRKSLIEGLDDAQLASIEELDQKALKIFHESKFHSGEFMMTLYRAIGKYIYGLYKDAYIEIKKTQACFLSGRGTFHETEYHFFYVLILARIYPQAPATEKRQITKSFSQSLKRMKMLSGQQSHNFFHKYLAMKAEYHRIMGQSQDASAHYELALEQVSSVFGRDTAVINELTACFHHDAGRKRMAQMFIRDAMIAYRNWKAHGKVKQLTEKWPSLRPEAAGFKASAAPRGMTQHSINMNKTQRGVGQALDLVSIVRAAQTLSGQVEMEGLIKHLMQIVIENAGAHYAVLMLKEKDKNQVRVIAKTMNNETTLLDNISLSKFPDISLGVMLYTSRVNETVIVDDFEKDEKFKADMYLQKVRPKSLLALPITIKGQVIGYFYLENRIVTGGFTADRVEVLNILGSQAAISLENAQLYSNLEYNVRERTSQLAEKNRDIHTILSNIKQGILTVTPSLKIHPEYSRYLEAILECKSLADKDFLSTIFHNSQLSPDAIEQIKSALDFSIQQDSLCFEFNAGLLIREMVRSRSNGDSQYLELDWEPILNDKSIVEKIMVTVRDVTELKKLRQASEKNRRELTILNQLLNTSSDRYTRFKRDADELIQKAKDLMENATSENPTAIDIAYRHLHTVKGNARLLGFTELASHVHECESLLDQQRTGSVEFARGQQRILDSIQAIAGFLHEYQRIYEDRLLSYGSAGENSTLNKLIKQINEHIGDWQHRYPEVGQGLTRTITNLGKKSLAEIMEPLSQNSARLAMDIGKAAPQFKIDGPNLLLEPKLETLLTNAFVHLFSNAVNHGLETPELRLKAGKPKEGQIHLQVIERDHEIEISVDDDGQGLNLAAIKAKAISKGLIRAHEALSAIEIAEMIFKSGFSTAETVSQSAGRGVGMDAIRDMIADAGGRFELILVEQSPFEGKKFQVRFILPKDSQEFGIKAA